jgi:peptidoglycan/xylan/chitin deacetylase (PgdA/CDA1 family)
MIIAAAGVSAVAAGVAAYGTFHRNSSLFGDVIRTLPQDGKVVSLTFDDGPNQFATPVILDALAQRDVRATFFFLGRHVERWPELVARAAREGHQIGNHGYYHRKLHFKSPAYVRNDLERGMRAIQGAGGGTPKLFRAPHGFRSPWVTPIATSLGERTVGWSLGVWDSDSPGVDTIVQRSVDGVTPGAILLLHDGDGYAPAGDRMQTALAVPQIIDQLRGRGYSFSTLPV